MECARHFFLTLCRAYTVGCNKPGGSSEADGDWVKVPQEVRDRALRASTMHGMACLGRLEARLNWVILSGCLGSDCVRTVH